MNAENFIMQISNDLMKGVISLPINADFSVSYYVKPDVLQIYLTNNQNTATEIYEAIKIYFNETLIKNFDLSEQIRIFVSISEDEYKMITIGSKYERPELFIKPSELILYSFEPGQLKSFTSTIGKSGKFGLKFPNSIYPKAMANIASVEDKDNATIYVKRTDANLDNYAYGKYYNNISSKTQLNTESIPCFKLNARYIAQLQNGKFKKFLTDKDEIYVDARYWQQFDKIPIIIFNC